MKDIGALFVTADGATKYQRVPYPPQREYRFPLPKRFQDMLVTLTSPYPPSPEFKVRSFELIRMWPDADGDMQAEYREVIEAL